MIKFLVMTHNLFLLISSGLETEEGILDEKVNEKNRAAQMTQKKAAEECGCKVSFWFQPLRMLTRWSSEFLRWLSDAVIHSWDWRPAVAKLRPVMLAYLR